MADVKRMIGMRCVMYSEHKYRIGAYISAFKARLKGLEVFIRHAAWFSDMMSDIFWVVYIKKPENNKESE